MITFYVSRNIECLMIENLPLASGFLERSLAKAHVLKSSQPADASALDMERTGNSFMHRNLAVV